MADPLDLLTLAEGREAINMREDNVDNDPVLARHITAISRLIDDRCGPVVQRTVTAELHDGCGTVLLKRWPVVAVDLVREANGGTITEVLPVTFGDTFAGYRVDLATGMLARVGSSWPWGSEVVEVTYSAGRFEDTGSVDARFKDVAAAILRRLWKREAGIWAQSSAFFEGTDDQIGSGFFRVAVPIIDEMLPLDRQPRAGIA